MLESSKRWCKKNPRYHVEYNKQWHKENPNSKKIHDKNYRETHKEDRRRYLAIRKQNEIQFKLTVNLRSRLYTAIKRSYKSGSAVRDLGCSIDYLVQYLEGLMEEGMTWDNWEKDGWHIDHVVPLSAFDLTDREQFLKACHYTNLQPMWAEENLSKGGLT